MTISDRLMSIANMTRGVMSDKDAEMAQQLSPAQQKELEEFRKKFLNGVMSDKDKSMSTRSPDGSTMDRLVKSTSDMIKGIPSDFDVQQILKNLPKTSDGSVKAREVEVAGEFEDMAMKLYQEAVEQGYKGTFFDFLIDRMDEEFDPASPMRVSKLPEGIMQLMNMMQNKRTT